LRGTEARLPRGLDDTARERWLRQAQPTSSYDGTSPSSPSAAASTQHFADLLDMTPEEHRRRGDAAQALFRKVTGKDTPGGA
jgi:hypothetical protein